MSGLGRRLARLEQHANGELEAEIARLAAEYGLHPDEIRHEVEEFARQRAHHGPEPAAVTVRRLAAEFDLDEAELWAEYERIRDRLGSRACAR